MSLLRNHLTVGASALMLVALTTPAAAQEQSGQQTQSQQSGEQTQSQPAPSQQNQTAPNAGQSGAPIPAYRSPLASATSDDSGTGTEQVQPDTRALSGAQTLSLGLATGHSYWQPHIDIFESADSNAQETTSGYSWGSWTSITGGVDFQHISGNQALTLSYLGGGTFGSENGVSGGMLQELSFADSLSLRRWRLTFLDQLSYLPESALGFGGLAGTSVAGGNLGGVGIGYAFQPGQTLLAAQGRSIGNSFVTEGDFSVTPRTSLTLAGGYALLDYPDSALLNSWTATARIGYNYVLNRKDTVAVLYTYNGFRYTNFDQSIDAHTIQVSYARRVTGRLAFQVAVGPQLAVAHTPISANANGALTPNSTEVFWALDTSAQYQLRRVALGLSYDHGISTGSGVLAGASSDTVQGSATRQMSPTFSSALTAGFSRNSGVAIDVLTPTNQSYNYWYVGANLSRPWRNVGLTLAYQLQYQDSNLSFCTGNTTLTCGTTFIRHVISVGVGWHGNRVVLR